MRMLGRRADLHAVIADAEAAGRSVRLVVGGMDKLSVLTAFADAIGAPSWFGKNYDALTDALRDLADAYGRTLIPRFRQPPPARLTPARGHSRVPIEAVEGACDDLPAW